MFQPPESQQYRAGGAAYKDGSRIPKMGGVRVLHKVGFSFFSAPRLITTGTACSRRRVHKEAKTSKTKKSLK